MPTRLIRDGILESEAVCSLSWAAEVFYRRIMSAADDYGRFSASPKLLRAACYPLQIDKVSDSDIGKWLTQVVEAGLVRVYLAQDGKRYLQIEKFGQQVRSKSKCPAPEECVTADATHQKAPDNNCSQMQTDAHLGVFVFEGGDGCEVGGEVVVAQAPQTQPSPPPPPPGLDPIAWEAWVAYRKAKKKPIRPESFEAAQKDMARYGADQQAVVQQSIAAGYQGLYALKPGPANRQQPPPRGTRDDEAKRLLFGEQGDVIDA